MSIQLRLIGMATRTFPRLKRRVSARAFLGFEAPAAVKGTTKNKEYFLFLVVVSRNEVL